MPAPCRHRRRRLLDALPPGSAALIPAGRLQLRNGDVHYPFRPSSDFFYLTDFDEPQGLLWLCAGAGSGREEVLFCTPRDPARERWDGPIAGPERAADQTGIPDCLPLTELKDHLPRLLDGVEQLFRSQSTPLAAELVDVALKQCGIDTQPLQIQNLDPHLHRLRTVKDDEELSRMREAAAITDRAHRRMMAAVRPGLWEYELEAECLFEFRRGGADGPAYPSIVGSGPNACVLHHIRNDRQLQDGDLVLVDAGCEYRGYAADITRTFPVSGRFSPEQRDVYQVVLRAQRAVMDELAPGVPYSRAQEVAVREITAGLIELGILSGDLEERIADRSFQPFYMHRVGHWLGMDVHDAGSYEDENGQSYLLQEGMVMTVEPGIYIDEGSPADQRWQGIGVRIEDDVVITAEGCELVGAAPPRELEEVEALTNRARSAKG